MKELRDYQKQVIEDLYAAIRKGFRKLVIVAPTGAGKSLVSAKIVSDITSKGKRVMFLVDLDELISQTYLEFKAEGLDCGFIKAGLPENPNALVQICSVQTLPRRAWWKEHQIDVVILDECHETAWRKVVKEDMMTEICPHALYIGLTATPYRLSSKERFGDIFETMVKCPLPSVLMDMGYLVKPSYYTIEGADLTKVKTKMGDFSEPDLSVACDKPELIKKAISEWQKLAFGRRTIVFCIDVKHAENVCREFRANGVPSAFVCGQTPIPVRKQYYRDLALGNLLVLVSVNVTSKGFNVPPVEVALMLRPTKSKAIYEQQLGRVLRISPETNKTCALILDQAGNVVRHRPIEEKTRYQLEHSKEDDGEENPVPLKECPECHSLMYGFVMTCKNCGYEFPAVEKSEVSGTLVRVFPNKGDEEKFRQYQSMLRQAFDLNHSPGSAMLEFKNRHNRYPAKDWSREAVFGENPDPISYATYYKHLAAIAYRLKKDEGWIKRFMTMEFGEGWDRKLSQVKNTLVMNEVRQLEASGVKSKDDWSWSVI